MSDKPKTYQFPSVAERMASAALRQAVSFAAQPISLVTVERGMDDLLASSSLSSPLAK